MQAGSDLSGGLGGADLYMPGERKTGLFDYLGRFGEEVLFSSLRGFMKKGYFNLNSISRGLWVFS
jgi:hypothetical protein